MNSTSYSSYLNLMRFLVSYYFGINYGINTMYKILLHKFKMLKDISALDINST